MIALAGDRLIPLEAVAHLAARLPGHVDQTLLGDHPPAGGLDHFS